MPGISYECESGQHQACTMGNECRCPHHLHTKELLNKGPAQTDPRGGIRRSDIPAPQPTIENTCPACGARAKATDVFCRKDGTKLTLGKQCLGCGSPGDSADEFCWQCGLKHGTKPPEPSIEDMPKEDRIEALKHKARELGLLRETTV